MITSNTFQIGIDTDTNPKFQREGTYRYALNASIETLEGDIPSLTTELGNSLCGDFPESHQLIGHVLIDDGTFVVFMADPLNVTHQIASFNPTTCTYTSIIVDSDLNFSSAHPVNALFKIRNGCEKIILFTDNYNPYRVINITQTSSYLNTDKSLKNPDYILYSRDLHSTPTSYNTSNLSASTFTSQGGLEYGSYAFYIRYLDSDENPTSDFIPLTDFFKITADSLLRTQTAYPHGASNVKSSPFYLPPSTLSIRLTIRNLSTLFSFYQLAVVKFTSEGGSLSSPQLLFPTPITSTTSSYTYSNNPSEVFSDVTIAELLTPNQRIEKVAAHDIDERRLFFGNVTNKSRDYSLYQKFASKIKVTYQSQASISDHYKADEPREQQTLTVMHNEVYSLGIVYVHKDGTQSPAFHIPGRPLNPTELTDPSSLHNSPYLISRAAWDTSSMVTATYSQNVMDAAKDKRWQVMSTASYTVDNEGFREGLLGYHETTTNYPDITACDGTSYWGNDYQGNPITSNDKIRHHRTPAEFIGFEAVSGFPNYQLRLLFHFIEFPNDDVIGYYLVQGDRTFERTVLDKGIAVPMKAGTEVNSQVTEYFYGSTSFNAAFTGSVTHSNLGFVSPAVTYKAQRSEPTYITVERIMFSSASDSIIYDNENYSVPEYAETLAIESLMQQYDSFGRSAKTFNYLLSDLAFLNKRVPRPDGLASFTQPNQFFTTFTNGDRIENRANSTDIIALRTASPTLEFSTPFNDDTIYNVLFPARKYAAYLISLKVDRDVFNNLFAIQYRLLTPNLFTTENILFPAPPLVVRGGDTQVTNFDTLEIGHANLIGQAFFASCRLESDYTPEYRYDTDIERGKYTYFKNKKSAAHDHFALGVHVANKYYKPTSSTSAFYQEYYELDDKYKPRQPLNIYLPPAFNYDYCNDCREAFPYRIYYTGADNPESQTDPSRITKVNNYRDLEGTTGSITDMFHSFDSMYVTTTNAVYNLPTRPQVLQTDEASIQIGTGEVLSLSPRKLSSPDYSLAGQQNFKTRTATEYGTFYFDELSKRPILLTSSPNDLSNPGLRNFFASEGKVYLKEQFEIGTSQPYPLTTPTHPYGVGFLSTFCPLTKTLYLTKKDYSILPQYRNLLRFSTSTPQPYFLTFNGSKFIYNTGTLTYDVPFTNTKFFQPKNFTLSYSFITKSWTSFHTYFPSYMMNDHQDFFTFSNSLYKHGTAPYLKFYEESYPHVIDVIATISPAQIQYTNNIYYLSKASIYDPNSETLFTDSNSTFRGVIFYNSYQSSGYHALDLSSSPYATSSPSNIIVSKVDRKYRVSHLRDYTVSNFQPIWSTDPTQTITEPYLDKVPNQLNINYSKSPFELSRLKDHYLGVRLFYYPTSEDIKLTTDVLQTSFSNKSR